MYTEAQRIIKGHGIEVKVVGRRVKARSVFSQNGKEGYLWVDVTNWSNDKALEWLGY